MVKEAIILAGGFGKRLKSKVKDIPKPMAEVGGKPFLQIILDYLLENRIKKVILSVAYKKGIIKKYFGNNYKGLTIIYAEEDAPLGTGGAIKYSLGFVESEDIFILNGDTRFNIPLKKIFDFHYSKKADLSIALKKITSDKTNRYGNILLNSEKRVISFKEKTKNNFSYINGGIYLLNINKFMQIKFPERFSFEKDYLEQYYLKYKFYGKVFDSYFIDIGIPEDYEKAKRELNR
jgi:D-glycero-alpha-D-manno-heptose 1-phosphate guanylyltransferase